jgi:hypothetical protein
MSIVIPRSFSSADGRRQRPSNFDERGFSVVNMSGGADDNIQNNKSLTGKSAPRKDPRGKAKGKR